VAGRVSDHKGLNLPGAAVSLPALSPKDERDLRWALDVGADMVALSFVRSAADYDHVRQVMDEVGRVVPVIAKIEKPQAVDNLADVVAAFDGIMVARGDLGVELALDRVPLVQKDALAMARRAAKPAIVATQVLESMMGAPRPTRAEVSDCANAVLDGADAVMLSGETSVGQYPVEAVRTMARIIETTETLGRDRIVPLGPIPPSHGSAITVAAVQIAADLQAKYLVTFTVSGATARRVSRLRPETALLALTPVEHTRNMLSLSWGARTFLVPQVASTDDMVRLVDLTLQDNRLAAPGDMVVVVAGTPVGQAGTTNTVLAHRVGDDDL
ncbi:MAG: pyruvate kinase, partial [Micrococcales bacterium]|nr:pyruvate kinase [Micrococcales bacterium]